MLAWWRQEAPPDARLRTIVLTDGGGDLIAIAPFFSHRGQGGLTSYRLLASARGTPSEPLARRGRELEAARLIVEQLGGVSPRPDLVRMDGATPAWIDALAEAWAERRRSTIRVERSAPAPNLTLSGRTFDEWFGRKSRNFRQQFGRSERGLEAHGFTARIAKSPDEIERGLVALASEHLDRWNRRGGSRVWGPGTLSMLREVEQRLRSTDRFRLMTIDDGREIISAHLFVAAGGHLSYWLGSFDERWARYHPGVTALVAALRDAWQRGDEIVDFGQGLHPYKLRLADGQDDLAWVSLIPGGLSGIRTRLRLAPGRGARALAGRLPTRARRRVRVRLGGAHVNDPTGRRLET